VDLKMKHRLLSHQFYFNSNSLKMTATKQSNHHFSFTIGVHNTQDKVWQTLIDVPTWHLWDTELVDAFLDVPFKVGAKGF
jgi:hypothetical protein